MPLENFQADGKLLPKLLHIGFILVLYDEHYVSQSDKLFTWQRQRCEEMSSLVSPFIALFLCCVGMS